MKFPELPKRESAPIEPHRLTPHAQLQMSHTTPLQIRLTQVNRLFESHPILGQKAARIGALAADRPIENKEHIAHLANILLNQEKPLWQSVRIHVQPGKPQILTQTELDILNDDEKKQVQEHAEPVRKLYNKEFEALCEYALISPEKRYENAKQDYTRFMAAAGAAQQLAAINDILDQQHLMLRKLDARLNLDAHRIAPLIEDIRLSFEDQKVITSRLPEFKFK